MRLIFLAILVCVALFGCSSREALRPKEFTPKVVRADRTGTPQAMRTSSTAQDTPGSDTPLRLANRQTD